MNSYDVIILGAGASGLLCASEAAARGRKVLLLDHEDKPGQKVLASGGGRCNFTNLHTTPDHYVGSDPEFPKAALARFKPKDFIKRVQSRRIPYHEKKDGQLFCDRSSKDIHHLLLEDLKDTGVQAEYGRKVVEVRRERETFVVVTDRGEVQTPKLVVATGGLSYPGLGASDLGYRLAQQFGLRVVEPSPALVGFTFPDKEKVRFKGLEGIHLRIKANIGKWNLEDDVMITHKGFSGPVMLNASLHWEEGQEVYINWVPEFSVEETFEQLLTDKAEGGRGQFRTWLSTRIPKRLAERLAWHAEARGAWAALPDSVLHAFAKDLHAFHFVPDGTFGYKEAEVTRGGVDTRDLWPKTLECRKVPGLYFIGEVLDVTGELGGFNLQWAWSSGFTVGQTV
jgi:predicted Rossmann fold flavoprotein